MTTRLSGFKRAFLVLLAVMSILVVSTTAAQDATATPEPGLPGLPTPVAVSEFSVGPLIVTVPNQWQSWTATKDTDSNKPPFALISYAQLELQSASGSQMQFAFVPKEAVTKQLGKYDAYVIADAYKAQILTTTTVPVQMSVLDERLWMLVPRAEGLIAIVVTLKNNADLPDIIDILGSMYVKGNTLDKSLKPLITQYIGQNFVNLKVNESATQHPNVASVFDLLPTGREIGIGEEYLFNETLSHAYNLSQLAQSYSQRSGKDVGNKVIIAGLDAKYVNGEVSAWNTQDCKEIEIEILEFQKPAGAAQFLNFQNINFIWMQMGPYPSYVLVEENTFIASGPKKTDCKTSSVAATYAVAKKNYIVIVRAVFPETVPEVEEKVKAVSQLITNKIQ